jgi:hypothetical protein
VPDPEHNPLDAAPDRKITTRRTSRRQWQAKYIPAFIRRYPFVERIGARRSWHSPFDHGKARDPKNVQHRPPGFVERERVGEIG